MKSAYYKQKIQENRFGINSYSEPATSYIGLFSDAAVTELSGGSYARVGVANNGTNWSYSGGTTENADANGIVFPTASADWLEAVAFGRFDAASSGNLLEWDWLHDLRASGAAANSGDVFTSYAHGFSDNDRVVFRAPNGGTLPTGISADTIYHVISATANTFQVSTSQGGAAVTLTGDGEFLAYRLQARTVTSGNAFRFPQGELKFTEAE